MKYLKNFESYGPATKPAEPKTIPTTKPNRPSPIRRDRPSVEPAPKAKKKLATAEDVIQRYVDETKISEGTTNSGPRTGGMVDSDPIMSIPKVFSDRISKELIQLFGNEDWFVTVNKEGQRDDIKYVVVANRILTDEELEIIPEEIRGYSVVVETK